MKTSFVAALLALLAFSAPAFSVSYANTSYTPTSGGNGYVSSGSIYMESHRTQRHSFVTADGTTHVIVNTGASSSALKIYSFNGGTNWVNTYTWTNTDGASTEDLALNTVTGDMSVIYTNSGGASVLFDELTWNSTTNTWALASGFTEQTAVANTWTGYTTSMQFAQPSFVRDYAGNVWAAYLSGPTPLYTGTPSNTLIQISYRAAAGTTFASKSGLLFANNDAAGGYVEHAPRLVATTPYGSGTSGVGLLYQSNQTLYWAQRLDTQSTTTQWSGSTIAGVTLPPLQSTIDDTAFSVATDLNSGKLYAASTAINSGGSQVIYTMKFAAGPANPNGVWYGTAQLTPSAWTTAYTKVALSWNITYGTTIWVNVNSGGSLATFYSTDGLSYNFYAYLTHSNGTPPGATPSFSSPRIEAPEWTNASGNPPPVWEQYDRDVSCAPPYACRPQGLVYWSTADQQ